MLQRALRDSNPYGTDPCFAVATDDPALAREEMAPRGAHCGTEEYQVLRGIHKETKAELAGQGCRVQNYIANGTE